MKKIEKEFDCVEMKRIASLRIYEETKDMTEEEELEYWRRKQEKFRRQRPNMRELDPSEISRNRIPRIDS